jgi:hypothetical protein
MTMWNDTTKMMLRYVLAIAISYATARGWLTEATGGSISQIVEQVIGLLAAFSPALYAAARIDNAPRPT